MNIYHCFLHAKHCSWGRGRGLLSEVSGSSGQIQTMSTLINKKKSGSEKCGDENKIGQMPGAQFRVGGHGGHGGPLGGGDT